MRIRQLIGSLDDRTSDGGASAVEYGLLVAAIAAVIVLIVFALGKFVKAEFKDTCDSIQSGASANIQAAANCP